MNKLIYLSLFFINFQLDRKDKKSVECLQISNLFSFNNISNGIYLNIQGGNLLILNNLISLSDKTGLLMNLVSKKRIIDNILIIGKSGNNPQDIPKELCESDGKICVQRGLILPYNIKNFNPPNENFENFGTPFLPFDNYEFDNVVFYNWEKQKYDSYAISNNNFSKEFNTPGSHSKIYS